MNRRLATLEAEILQLDPAERTHLLDRLVASLEADLSVERAWEKEAERREAQLESGLIKEVSGPDAVERMRSRLPK